MRPLDRCTTAVMFSLEVVGIVSPSHMDSLFRERQLLQRFQTTSLSFNLNSKIGMVSLRLDADGGDACASE